MNLRQFWYFVGVVDAGSFSRAAASLLVAQPALSEQISKLEKELGAELLIRSQRGVQPTAAGNRFYRSARAVLNEIEHLKSALKTGDDLVGEVSLGLTSSFAGTFSGPIVSAVFSRHPRIRLNIVDAAGPAHIDGLLRGTLDIVLLPEDIKKSTGLHRQPLYRQNLFFVEQRTSNAPSTGAIAMADLINRSFVLPPMPNASRAVIEKAFLAFGAKPNVVAEANSRSAILSLVEAGIGGSLIAWSGPPDPLFQWSEITGPTIHHDVSLATARLLPRSEAVEAVQEIVQDIVLGMVLAPAWKGATPHP